MLDTSVSSATQSSGTRVDVGYVVPDVSPVNPFNLSTMDRVRMRHQGANQIQNQASDDDQSEMK